MNCAICREVMVKESVSRHHVIPRAITRAREEKPSSSIFAHMICHKILHILFTNEELAEGLYTAKLIRSHPTIIEVCKWLKEVPEDWFTQEMPPTLFLIQALPKNVINSLDEETEFGALYLNSHNVPEFKVSIAELLDRKFEAIGGSQ